GAASMMPETFARAVGRCVRDLKSPPADIVATPVNIGSLAGTRKIIPDLRQDSWPNEYAQDQDDFAVYINYWHRRLVIADGSRVDRSDPVSYSKRWHQIPFLEPPSHSRST